MNSIDLGTLITTIFVLVDDWYQKQVKNTTVVKPGVKARMSDSELRSAHAPFWYQGVGAVLVTDTANLRTPHYHKPSDVPATIERSFFTGAAQIVVNATSALLEKDQVLETQSPS